MGVGVPSGTVTFLFTDVEGSTRLWQADEAAMRVALERHDAIVRTAIDGHEGHVFATGGDGFAAAFFRAGDAVAAAAQAQEGLAAESWPEGAQLRVRIGVHTGEAAERDGDYFGTVVNRAARLMAAGHGGQVLVSAATADLLDADGLVDLGVHRLRDLAEPQRVFQVGAALFPPLRSLDAFRSNLPYELSSFVGRVEELRAVAERVRSSRVVTVVGVGGVGKTRLALQVGSEVLPAFRGRGVVVRAGLGAGPGLDPRRGGRRGRLRPAAGRAGGRRAPPVPGAQGAAADPGQLRASDRRGGRVRDRDDPRRRNGYRCWPPAGRRWVSAASRVSRSRRSACRAATDAASVLVSEAGALFAARATEARGTFELDEQNAGSVRGLCERLDGVALAIELAAAQTVVMSPAEILARLDRKFHLITGGRRVALERHQTLRAAIDWSYELLGDTERALCDRLSVCVAGFDLDAAVALAAGLGVDEFDAVELVASLVAKSLVERSERTGVTRYRQLEMIRQYAADHLNTTGFGPAARDDHAAHYLALATSLFAEMAGPGDYVALDRLEIETANVAAAARWLLGGDRLGEVLGFFDRLPYVEWAVLPVAIVDELGGIAGEALDRPEAAAMAGFARTIYPAGQRAWLNSDLDALRHLGGLAERLSDPDAVAEPLIIASVAAAIDGDFPTAISVTRRCVAAARRANGPLLLSNALAMLAVYLGAVEDAEASALADEALAVARRSGGTVIRLYPLRVVAVRAYAIRARRGARRRRGVRADRPDPPAVLGAAGRRHGGDHPDPTRRHRGRSRRDTRRDHPADRRRSTFRRHHAPLRPCRRAGSHPSRDGDRVRRHRRERCHRPVSELHHHAWPDPDRRGPRGGYRRRQGARRHAVPRRRRRPAPRHHRPGRRRKRIPQYVTRRSPPSGRHCCNRGSRPPHHVLDPCRTCRSLSVAVAFPGGPNRSATTRRIDAEQCAPNDRVGPARCATSAAVGNPSRRLGVSKPHPALPDDGRLHKCRGTRSAGGAGGC